MSSNLKVNTILPSTGTVIGIGTAGGTIDFIGNTNINTTGVITATSFVGSGANLTNLPAQVNITGNADNRVITGGSGVNLNGEANLTFSGATLKVNNTSGHSYLKLNSNDSYSGSIHFGDQSDDDAAQIWYDNYQGNGMYLRTSENTPMSFYTNGTPRFLIKADGSTFLQTSNVNINRGTSGAGYPLTVRGPNDGDAIRIERGNQYQWHIGQDTNGGGSNLYFKSNTTKEIVFPSTGGIAFNGEYVANNTLNDYELGNWNSAVQWQNGNTTGGYNNTTTVQGTYLKIGNVVHVWITVYPNQYNSGGDCVIVGIPVPFAISAGGAVAFAPYSGRGNYGGWLTNSTYPRTYANLNSSGTKIVPLVTGNENGAGYWGHKSGTVNANASFTATYYTA